MKWGAVLSTADVNVNSQQISATPGATVTLDITTGTFAKWTAGEAETVNASGTQFAGQNLTCIIVNDGTLGRVITFGTGFKSIGVLTGTISKVGVIKFISDGTNFYELARTLLL